MDQTRRQKVKVVTLPYKTRPLPPKHSLPSPSPAPAKPLRKTPVLVGGLFIYAVSAYTFYLYTSLSKPPSSIPQDTDVSSRYDVTAPTFDIDVNWTEKITGLTALRRELTQHAYGHVLESSVGTGRNGEYYNLQKCKSITFVDLSSPMIAIAREKFKAQHPAYADATFLAQSAFAPLPSPAPHGGKGFTTILQTMGLCSTPDPAGLLRHLGTLLDPEDGRVWLLEHGRSYYGWVNWVLDRMAGKQAELHGCWWNRDVGQVLEKSGLEIVEIRRTQLGTVWWVQMKRGVEGGQPGIERGNV